MTPEQLEALVIAVAHLKERMATWHEHATHNNAEMMHYAARDLLAALPESMKLGEKTRKDASVSEEAVEAAVSAWEMSFAPLMPIGRKVMRAALQAAAPILSREHHQTVEKLEYVLNQRDREIERLNWEIASLREALKAVGTRDREIERLKAESDALAAQPAVCVAIVCRAIVNEQAEDPGLWFQPIYASEAHLQKALRRLHAAVEGKTERECAIDALENSQKSPTNELTTEAPGHSFPPLEPTET